MPRAGGLNASASGGPRRPLINDARVQPQQTRGYEHGGLVADGERQLVTDLLHDTLLPSVFGFGERPRGI